MSHVELQRFAAAVQESPALLDSYKTAASPADLAARLRGDGYDVTDAELEEVTRAGSELSDDQLDAVSGGLVAELAATAVGIAGLTALGGAILGIVLGAKKAGTIPETRWG
ncbi:Nif11-like leader peptide family RiPP precursor [Azospirillum sp.]|uniref:Nif11-like leader peptide family RiPP precursor n=1 Tax=Azospirillum sp. TaxID=34012 RepID=UPI003D7472CE